MMDFLDPKRKKAHRRRLLIGYLLVAIAIAMGTLILLFSAFGYWVDRKTGDVIQNGTVFLDSKPGGSTVFLDGQVQGNKTATRLVLPGGYQYTIKLTQDGYRDWTRTFSLGGGRIERLVYPLLLPNTLKSTEAQLYSTAPVLASQSPDRRWLLVQQPGQTHTFDLYDLNSPENAPAVVTIPSVILSDAAASATLKVVEWSNDNRHVLLERVYGNNHEFLMLDTTNVASSVNINTTLTAAPTQVALRDKKFDQLYVYEAAGGTLRLGDLKSRTISSALLNNILAFKSYGSDIVLYATREGATAGKVDFRIRENDKATYLLKTTVDGSSYLMDLAEYDGTPYYVVGTNQDEATFIYRDPLPTLKGQSRTPLLVSSVLRLSNPQFVSFSANTQFIATQTADKILVYDIEADRQYRIDLGHSIPASTKVAWMDGFRFIYTDTGQSYIIDFDGSNPQQLVASGSLEPFFAPDYETVFAIAPSTVATGRFALTQTSLLKK
jgi:hypothetical protein